MTRPVRARNTRPGDAGDPGWVAWAKRPGAGSVLDLRRRSGVSRSCRVPWCGDATCGGGTSRGCDATRWRGNSLGGTSDVGQTTSTNPVVIMTADTPTTIAVQPRLGTSTPRTTMGRTAGWMRPAHLSQRPPVKATPRPRHLIPSSFAWPKFRGCQTQREIRMALEGSKRRAHWIVGEKTHGIMSLPGWEQPPRFERQATRRHRSGRPSAGVGVRLHRRGGELSPARTF
jgi:hypothetical protein